MHSATTVAGVLLFPPALAVPGPSVMVNTASIVPLITAGGSQFMAQMLCKCR